MWRDELTSYEPSSSRYSNNVRSYNGALWFPAPGVIVTQPGCQTLADNMYSVEDGRKQDMHTCRHYTCIRRPQRSWAVGRRFWYNTGNKVFPNPGCWVVSAEPVKDQWLAYGQAVSPSSTYGTWDNPVTGLPVLAVSSVLPNEVTLLPSITQDERNILVQDALRAMLPGIKSRLSLPNTLFELKDMKTLSRSMKRIQTALKVARPKELYGVLAKQGLRGLASLRKGSPLRTILRGAADGYLQNAFNLQPLLRDITGIRDTLLRLNRDLEDLRRRANIAQRRHYARPLSGFSDSTEVGEFTLNTANVVPTMTAVRSVRYDVSRFTATIRYSYSVPAYSDLSFKIRGLLDGLGVNFNPAIIWNAIPWSFVVDWVFGVSRWLDQFQSRNIEPVVHVSGFCATFHVKRTITTSATHENDTGLVLVMSEDAYDRVAGMDQVNWTSSIRSSGINLKEFILSTALALSR